MPSRPKNGMRGLNKKETAQNGKKGLRTQQVRPDILLVQLEACNICVLEDGAGKPRVLVDTGPQSAAPALRETVCKRYGSEAPAFLVLLNGRESHAGAAKALAAAWDVPVYAGKSELAYLKGEKTYADGERAANIPDKGLLSLPEDGAVPGMEDWEWIAAPGDTQGQIALFRKKDGMLITGGAVSGVGRAVRSLTGSKPEDKTAVNVSAKTMRSLRPTMAVPASGRPIAGAALESLLTEYALRAGDEPSAPCL